MKNLLKIGMLPLLLCLLTAACSDDEEDKGGNIGSNIEVPATETLTQDTYADETETPKTVAFTTKSAWTSSISTGSATRAATDSTWVSVSPDHGDRAGKYDLSVNLERNFTGSERSAVITINCGGDRIEIHVSQAAEKQDGTIPEDPITQRPAAETLDRTVYADATTMDDLTFATSADWSWSATSDSLNTLWYSATPQKGGAGTHTVSFALETNYSGKNRSSLFTVDCQGSKIKMRVTQLATKADGSIPEQDNDSIPAIVEIDIEKLLGVYEDQFASLEKDYYNIDAEYCSDTARQSLNPSSKVVEEFWNSAYKAVDLFNKIEHFVSEAKLSEAEKATHRARSMAYRGTTYFYLTTLFGKVPLYTEYTGDLQDVKGPSEIIEINDFAIHNFSFALENAEAGTTPTRSWLYRQLALVQMQSEKWGAGLDAALKGINEQVADTTRQVNDLSLIAAEGHMQTQNTFSAFELVNQELMRMGMEPLADYNDSEKITATIRSLWQKHGASGMKLMNATRWGETKNWQHPLLPIPQSELDRNPYMAQNPGW